LEPTSSDTASSAIVGSHAVLSPMLSRLQKAVKGLKARGGGHGLAEHHRLGSKHEQHVEGGRVFGKDGRQLHAHLGGAMVSYLNDEDDSRYIYTSRHQQRGTSSNVTVPLAASIGGKSTVRPSSCLNNFARNITSRSRTEQSSPSKPSKSRIVAKLMLLASSAGKGEGSGGGGDRGGDQSHQPGKKGGGKGSGSKVAAAAVAKAVAKAEDGGGAQIAKDVGGAKAAGAGAVSGGRLDTIVERGAGGAAEDPRCVVE
jgi:hypothetical protein